MSDNPFEIDGVVVWDADCGIDADIPPEESVIIMTYRGNYQYLWSYQDVENALKNGVESFVKAQITHENVRPQDVDELGKFFEYWMMLANSGGNMGVFEEGEE
jgi:hypothetical protein